MTTITIIPPPEAAAAIDDAKTVAQVTRGFKVTTAAEQIDAGDLLQRIKGAAKRLIERRKAITDPLDESRRAAMALFADALTELEQGERDVKRAIGAFIDDQERIRRQAQAAADELARKERERLQAQAAKAEAAGRAEKAERLANQAAVVVAPVVQTSAPAVSGLANRKAWKFEIVDPSLVPREYLMVDEQKIRRVVAAMQSDANIPGVRTWAETVIASRSK